MSATSTQTVEDLPQYPAQPFKNKDFSLKFFNLMVRTRVLEEKLIKMAKSQDGFFWIGGPGEEAFNVALGLQVKKGQGPLYDYLHLHYRSNGCVLAMGAPMVDFVRQMKCSSADPYSGGRNFVSHIAKRDWNIVPVTSTIGTQFSVAPGTARAQMNLRRENPNAGITMVVGGDAGTAEGDFATALIWASRPGEELPLLMIVTNNQYGISTPAETQHGEKNISDRAKAFGIKTAVIEGNQPEKAWTGIRSAMEYVRESGKPFVLEARVSRLYGHSSSSGANRIEEECPIENMQKKLIKLGWITEGEIRACYDEASREANEALDVARKDPQPDPNTIYDHSFSGNGKSGLPGRDC